MQTSTLKSVLDHLCHQAGTEGIRAARLALLLTVGLAAAGVGVLASQQEKPKAEPIAAAPTDLYGDPLPDGALARLGTARLRHAGLHQVIFSGDAKSLSSVGSDHCVRRWELSSGKLKGAQSITEPPGVFGGGFLLSPDCKTVAWVGRKYLYFFDAATGKELHHILGDDFMDPVTFTADGKQVALRTLRGDLLLFDVATGQPIETDLNDIRLSRTIALDPKGKKVASLNQNGDGVDVWKLPGGKQLQAMRMKDCTGMVFAPDGNHLLLTSGEEAALWSSATGEKAAAFTFPRGFYWYSNACFSPDGTRLAVSSDDTVLLLDVTTLQEIRRLKNRGCYRF